MAGKKYTTKKAKNLKMNDEVYSLRRKVMELIYEFKTIVEIPRVTVRIIEETGNILGLGSMDERICVWIPQGVANAPKDHLREIVYHEIGHAVFKLKHDEKCPLMSSSTKWNGMTKAQCSEIVKNWE